MRPKKQIKLEETERITLEECVKHHKNSLIRERAQALLYNSRGYSIEMLGKLYGKKRHTIGIWIKRWEDMGFIGLRTDSGRYKRATLANAPESV